MKEYAHFYWGFFLPVVKTAEKNRQAKRWENDKRGIFKHGEGLAFEHGTQKETKPRYNRCSHALKYRARTTNEAGEYDYSRVEERDVNKAAQSKAQSARLELLKTVKESAVIKEVQAVIDATGLEVQRINTGAFATGTGNNRRFIRSCKKGTLDFEGYDNHGRFLGIECKRPIGGRISPEQAARIADINKKGGIAFITRSGSDALTQLEINKCI